MPSPPVALTIAGSDSSAGAGIQADLKTFAAFQVYGTSAITALTAQNTTGVLGAVSTSADFVDAQIAAITADFDVGAAKTGMLGTIDVVRAVAARLRDASFPVVVDPVLAATSGDSLAAVGVKEAIVDELIPLAAVLTPNTLEAAAILGTTIRTLDDQAAAGRALLSLGARAVLMKGGHLNGRRVVDLLLTREGARELSAKRIETTSTHGTGCTLAAAIAASLAAGRTLDDAVDLAHAYVHRAIRAAVPLGKGHGPLHHFHAFHSLSSTGTGVTTDDDRRFMALALDEAKRAAQDGEVPVGAVIVKDGVVVATGRNTRESARDPTGHAELNAIRDAAKALDAWRLVDATLYVTLEPCFMCAGAIVNARLSRLVFGARDAKAGAQGSLASVVTDVRLNHRVDVHEGVLADESAAMLSSFFSERRR